LSMRIGNDQYLTFNTVNLTSSLASEVRWTQTGKEADASTIGNPYSAFLQGQTDVSVTVSGTWDDGTAATSLDALLQNNMNGGGTKLVEWMPGGSAASRPLYKANGFVTAYEMGGAVNDKVGFSATIRIAGSPIRSISS
jgi:hypothetical protein